MLILVFSLRSTFPISCLAVSLQEAKWLKRPDWRWEWRGDAAFHLTSLFSAASSSSQSESRAQLTQPLQKANLLSSARVGEGIWESYHSS